jgi:hypothetical protein
MWQFYILRPPFPHENNWAKAMTSAHNATKSWRLKENPSKPHIPTPKRIMEYK